MTSHVTIVVLNWNNAADTVACLGSLQELEYHDYSVLVVDNGSSDDSVAVVRSAFPHVDMLETGANLGYAGGNNAGIRRALEAGAGYVLLLNNDVLVSPGSVRGLVNALEASSSAGFATPLIAETARPALIWSLGAVVDRQRGAVERLHAGRLVDEMKHVPPFSTDVAPGAAMLVKRAVLEQVGPLDEGFFLYFEEADWCLRAGRAGYDTVAVPSSVVWHKVSATLGPSSALIDYYMVRNQFRFISRHWSGKEGVRLLAALGLKHLLTVLSYTVKSHHGARVRHRNARLLALRDAVRGRTGPMDAATRLACDV